jgi:hypothetical protein
MKVRDLQTLYSIITQYILNPRIPVNQLHRISSHFKAKKSTEKLLKKARQEKILIGPRIYCNSGIDIKLYMKDEICDVYRLFKEKKSDPSVRYAVAFCGEHAVLVLKRGASVLQYAEAVIPSYPAKKTIEQINLVKKGELKPDPFPHKWDELDWKVYYCMKDPLVSFPKVAGSLGVTWQTVKNRYEHVLESCKTWISFFPQGYNNYSQTFLTFRTDYEVGLREELQKLDRTTFLYKFGDTILVNLFYELSIEHYVFSELEKEGLIRDLSASIPIEWYKPDLPFK